MDDTVLRLFTKRKKGVELTIYTKKDCLLALDVNKYQSQYGPVSVKEFTDSHDRFLIIDGTVVYHIGASLKDLGKKWFAFSRMEIAALELLTKLK
ncbi:fic family toxin-antitoxin system [Pedobacter nutrimenti]|uniref:fic family toxin-antitoxin system n=1 Tax=Pedobacter nutrimenti TaxID=1241337 RepID=UPI0029315579|nr:fic family toxin-antitoxin system [Pedobacter nutrimenti]